MIPIFEDTGMKAALVERKDKPGLLGVAVRGGRFVCPLPEGYDGRCAITVHQGYVLVGHPTLPPLRCDPTKGTIELIEPHHVDAHLPGRLKLNTQ